jgi:TolA-binding protein
MMMKTMRSLVPVILLAVLTACGGDAPKTGITPETNAAMEAVKRIRTQEDSLFAKTVFDRKGAMAMRDVYLSFAKNFPLDTMTPEYLFRAAGVSRSLGEPKETLALYDRVIKNYPGWSRIVDTYYLRAFTIDSDLGQKGEAKTAYEEVMHRFPDHKFAKDAAQMIENLQFTDEQLIEKFKKMNEAGEAPAGN